MIFLQNKKINAYVSRMKDLREKSKTAKVFFMGIFRVAERMRADGKDKMEGWGLKFSPLSSPISLFFH